MGRPKKAAAPQVPDAELEAAAKELKNAPKKAAAPKAPKADKLKIKTNEGIEFVFDCVFSNGENKKVTVLAKETDTVENVVEQLKKENSKKTVYLTSFKLI